MYLVNDTSKMEVLHVIENCYFWDTTKKTPENSIRDSHFGAPIYPMLQTYHISNSVSCFFSLFFTQQKNIELNTLF